MDLSKRAGAVAVLTSLALLATGAAAVAETPAAEARIGALVLAYDPAQWQVDPGTGAYVISCLAEACDGTVLDVTVTEQPTGFCDRDEVRTTAESLFSFADRHPTNIYALGDLALVMAQSRHGSAFDVPVGVFACLTREGQVYRFQSRAGATPFSQHTGGIMLDLLGGLSAPPAVVEDIRVGDVMVSYAKDVWHTFSPEPAEGLAVLHCLPPTCYDIGPRVLVGAAAGEAGCFDEMADDPYHSGYDWPRVVSAGAPGAELSFQVHSFWSGCRNATPPRLLACAVHDGVTYRIEAPGAIGCLSAPDVPLDAFMALVESARLAP